MRRIAAIALGLVLVSAIPAASIAQGTAGREAEMARAMRGILAQTGEPRQVAALLARHGAHFTGYQQTRVTFAYTGEAVVPTQAVTTSVDSTFLTVRSGMDSLATEIQPLAGQKTDFTLTMWLYEWRNRDGTYTEQVVLNGYWTETEYPWLDDPLDVIDVRWIVGDLVYLASHPFDGVQRDQHTNGIASFTVSDQVGSWDLFVSFKPVSSAVHGRWTNIFANFTHTWWGVRLGITLGAGPTGSTGTIAISTDAKTWTEGTGLAFRIGSGESRGPVSTGYPTPGAIRQN